MLGYEIVITLLFGWGGILNLKSEHREKFYGCLGLLFALINAIALFSKAFETAYMKGVLISDISYLALASIGAIVVMGPGNSARQNKLYAIVLTGMLALIAWAAKLYFDIK